MLMEEMILVCAVRYALGRMSYVVGEVCQYVTLHRKKLSKECINVIIRDIEDELERYHAVGQLCGMECDEWEWKKLLKILKEV